MIKGKAARNRPALTAAGERALEIARELVRCPSVTPKDAGALDYLQGVLEAGGFACHRLPFSEEGTADVDNLFARIGEGPPHLCFAGHTDVVPPGDEAAWTRPPFGAEVADGWLHGRGACDMKGAVACFAAAALDLLAEHGGRPPGSLSFLITGDEEGPSINGTAKVLTWMAERGHVPDHCLLGEPTSTHALGDAIKIGRRGSLNVWITVTGTQGHVAYTEQTNNPITGLLAVLNALMAEPLDSGTDMFLPSNLEVTGIDAGNPTPNIVPARVAAAFNFRFNETHTSASLEAMVRDKTTAALKGSGLGHALTFQRTGECFLNRAEAFTEVIKDVVNEVTGREPALSTGGGTSDGRFIWRYCPVIELGLVNATIHQVDERVPLADLDALTGIYRRIIDRYFVTFGAV